MTSSRGRGRFTPLGDNLLVRPKLGEGPLSRSGGAAWLGTVEGLSSSLASALIRRGDVIAVRSGAGDLVGSCLVLVGIDHVLAIVDPLGAEDDPLVVSLPLPTSRGN